MTDKIPSIAQSNIDPEETLIDTVQEKHTPSGLHVEMEVSEKRFYLFFIFCIVVLMFVGGKMLLLAWDQSEWRSQAYANKEHVYPISAPRGIIYDAQGKPLVSNVPSFDLILYRVHDQYSDEEEIRNALEGVINIPSEELTQKISEAHSAQQYILLRENIGLEKLVDMDRGFIQIDDLGRTKSKGLWAIGDCTPGPWLAHKASHEGVTAAEAIAQELGVKGLHPHGLDRNNIPGCTYCHPQIASVGMTEEKAKEAGYDVKAGTFPFIGNGKAIALGEAEGFVKTVFDAKTGELLGAHMIGAEVTEMIQGYVVGKTLETTEAELMQTVFPHPTISESMHESVLAAYGRALHI